MHRLLERQLRRHFGAIDKIPAELGPFLKAVSDAYDQGDKDRELLERAMEISSRELVERNADLRHEVAERERTSEELRGAYERVRELDRFRTQFINNAAHELATPLTPIKIQIHLLRGQLDGSASDKQRSALATLERNLDRLGALTKDLLDAARIQSARMDIVREPHDAARLAVEVVESFAGLARESEIELATDLDGPLPVSVDRRRLEQVLYNLLSNAMKFAPRGGRVVVRGRRTADEGILEVSDTGPGIPKEQIARLFQPFSQVHDKTEVKSGSGLGLYISHSIVHAHGGRIWCESEGRGRGATFRVALPIRRAD